MWLCGAYTAVMPTTEFTQTITVVHDFVPGQVITDGRYTFKIVRVDAEAEEYIVDDLDSPSGRGQGVDISYTDVKFGLKPKQVVYVCYTEAMYEGCSNPLGVHRTLESAQESFAEDLRGRKIALDWKGPDEERVWSAKISSSDWISIAEMEVLP